MLGAEISIFVDVFESLFSQPAINQAPKENPQSQRKGVL
jgi:hypothetical protein